MKARISSTSIHLELDLSQRECELLNAMFGKLSGFKARDLAGIGSGEEWTDIVHAVGQALDEQPTRLITGNGISPKEVIE